MLLESSENQDRHQDKGRKILRVKGFTISARTLGTSVHVCYPLRATHCKLSTGHAIRGAFASVRLATHNATKRQVACKVMKNSMIAKKGFCQQIKHEIAVLADLDHVRAACLGRASRAGLIDNQVPLQPNLAIFLDTHEDTEHTYIFMELYVHAAP